ncbi:MAG: flagellin FliC [Nitrospinae bacterium]|nr:flagellin FliC [Nitrospinota bacterium]
MAIRIFTNLISLNAQRILGINNARLAQSIERISSGLRINRASDDVGGLAVAESLRSDIRVLRQGLRNLNDGLSLVNVAEAGMNQQSDILIRMRELAAQSASGTLTDAQRANLQLEFVQLRNEIDRISNATEFNGQTLLDGSLAAGAGPIVIFFGLDATANSQIDLNAEADVDDLDAVGLGIDTLDISTQAGATTALTDLDTALDTLSGERASLGAVQNRLTRIIPGQAILVENLQAAESQIRDADIAEEVALLARNQILVEAATAMVAQANIIPEQVLKLLPSN